MTFNHIKKYSEKLPDLDTINIEGKRHYVTPQNQFYPSVTTVLSGQNREGIDQWRKEVGEGVADTLMRLGAIRGNAFHKILENYLDNKDISIYKNKVLATALFNRVKSQLDRIDNIFAQEKTLYSNNYCIAGRVDCIAEFDGTPSVIDFKTSTKEKKSLWIENYYLQETAYSLMWEEQTSLPVGQIVTIIACEDGAVQTFIEQRDSFVTKLEDCIAEYTAVNRNIVVRKK